MEEEEEEVEGGGGTCKDLLASPLIVSKVRLLGTTSRRHQGGG